jgi:probable rRNA maturation factor
VPVDLTCRAVSARPFADALRADALALLKILALGHCELSLMLVGDVGMRRLNREFRAKDQPTDVLSFPQLESAHELVESRALSSPDGPPLALGDIVISIDTARRQARELGQSAGARIRTLLIHGTLHLLGYDHQRSMDEARRMFAREHELAALMDTGGRGSQSRLSKARMTAGERLAITAVAVGELQSSPAAMLERMVKAVKKPIVVRQHDEVFAGRRPHLYKREV